MLGLALEMTSRHVYVNTAAVAVVHAGPIASCLRWKLEQASLMLVKSVLLLLLLLLLKVKVFVVTTQQAAARCSISTTGV